MATGLPQPVPVTEGGTGARTTGEAKDNLGLGKLVVSDNSHTLILDTIDITNTRELIIPDFDGTISVMIFKSTTGDPEDGLAGIFCLNTFDKNLKFYADGSWHEVANWS